MALRPYPWLVLSFFGFFFSYGVFLPFFPDYLKFNQIDPEVVGFLISSGFIFRFLGSVFFTRLIKDASMILPTLRKVAWLSFASMLALGCLVNHFWLMCICLSFFSFVSGASMPLGDTLATTWGKQVPLDYGRVRLIGSLSFACGTLIFGEILGIVGQYYTVWIIVGILLMYSLLQMSPPAIQPQNQEQGEHIQAVPKVSTLLKNYTILRVILSVTLVQGSHASFYVYSVIYWQSMGLKLSQTSLILGVSVLIEVVFFFFVSKIFGKWKIRDLFYISAFASVIRWTLFPFVTGFYENLLLQGLHCLTYALNHYAMVRFISNYPTNSIASLQGLYNAIAGSAAVGVFGFIASKLYPIDPAYAFYLMAGLALLSLVLTPWKLTNAKVERI